MSGVIHGKVCGRRGFVLPMTLILLTCTAITLGAVLSYVSFHGRRTRNAVETTRLRFAAQSAIEEFKSLAVDQFTRFCAQPKIHITVSYNDATQWFTGAAGAPSIGAPGYVASGETVTLINDGKVYLALFNVAGDPTLTVVATAEGRYGLTATVAERVLFAGEQRSDVFNYAYFVNNYGWMNGSSIVINGDMRANGDMSITGSTVNGKIYAARNDEVGAEGEISFAPVTTRSGRTTTYTYPNIWSQSKYWSDAGASARPTSPSWEEGGSWSGGFEAPASNVTLTDNSLSDPEDAGYAYLFEDSTPVAMPYISALDEYREYAEDLRAKAESTVTATLKYSEVSVDGNGNLSLGARKTITVSNYDTDDNVNTTAVNEMLNSSSAGPTGSTAEGDRGAVVLVGTYENPIEIDGPVVIASDVVIMGYVTGQGTIYSGRNIHIVGDLTYKNAPTWSHPDETPEATKTANASKDMISLMAKGCVVVGDPTTSEWKSSIEPYITGSGSGNVSQQYYCDDNDVAIGYPASTEKFDGDYTASCGLSKYYDSAYCVPVTVQSTDGGETWSYVTYSTPVLKELETPYSATTRNLTSEKVADSEITTSTKQVRQGWNSYTTVTVQQKTIYEIVGDSSATYYSKWSSRYSSTGYYANESARYYDSLIGDALLHSVASKGNALVYGGGTSAGVSKINAVIYDNHGTFGQVGRSNCDFVLNGSLICRDEALVGASGIGKMIFNWDIRLKQDGAEGLSNDILGLPINALSPQTLMWQLVPDSWNPNYPGGK